MIDDSIPERTILNNEIIPIVVVSCVSPLFEQEYPDEFHQWEDLVQQGETSPTLTVLCSLFTELFYPNQLLTKYMIRSAVVNYADSIKEQIRPYLKSEHSQKLADKDFMYTSMNPDYQLMRDLVTNKKRFTKDSGVLTAQLVDTRGKVRGVAELRPLTINAENPETETEQMWLSLMESTLQSLDEWTADLFDMICYFWTVQSKDMDGYIHFHSDDALRLRFFNLATEKFSTRERERFSIMKRVAALTSIWVSISGEQLQVVNAQMLNDADSYDFTRFTRMFEIGTVDMAYDKKTGEAKGIYSLQIKPAPILAHYLRSGQYTFGALDMKVFQYSHYKQREHKRFTRYLNYQWKIRTIRRTLSQPFRIKTLIEAIEFPASYNGVELRDRFERLLDDLQRDQVIKEWSYVVPVDESRVGKRSWVPKYWATLLVYISPPDNIVVENMKKVDSQVLVSQSQQMTFDVSMAEIQMVIEQPKIDQSIKIESKSFESESIQTADEATLIVNKVRAKIQANHLSLRQAAVAMGMSHATLTRILKNTQKRYQERNLIKMKGWVQEDK